MSIGAIDPSIPAETVLRVHPTQLYEAGAGLIILLTLQFLILAINHARRGGKTTT